MSVTSECPFFSYNRLHEKSKPDSSASETVELGETGLFPAEQPRVCFLLVFG